MKKKRCTVCILIVILLFVGCQNTKDNSLPDESSYFDETSTSSLSAVKDSEEAQIEESGTDMMLYEQIFKTAALGELSPEFETFFSALAQAGYSYIEEEGTFSVEDLANMGSYMYGSLTNQNDRIEVASIGYCFAKDGKERIVEADILDGNFKYYIEIIFPDSKREVTDYMDLENFLLHGQE